MSDFADAITILNTIPLACYALDHNANFSFINEKALTYFKMTGNDMLGKNVWELFPESTKTDYYHEINNAIINKKETTFEYVSVFTGSWIKLTVTPFADGVVVTFSCIEKDKYNENLYKTLVENTPDIVTKWDSSLKLSYGNAAFENKLELSLNEAIGKTHQEIWPEADVKPLTEKMQVVLNEGSSENITIPVKIRDNVFFYNVKMAPELTINGKVKSVISIGRDISELKASQESINADLASKYKSLFNSIHQGFCIIDLIWDSDGNAIDYGFVEVNPAFEKLTGISDITKTIRQIYPEAESHWFKIYGEVAKTKTSAHFELPATLIDGWYEVEAFPIKSLGENIVGVLFNDVTKRKYAEEVLRKDEIKELEKKQQKEILKASLNAQEEERQRIAESLHNGLGQVLYGVKATLERLNLEDNNAIGENIQILDRSKELLGMCIQESRKISHELMPSILEDFGLKVSIKDICNQLKGKTHFNCTFSDLDVPMDKYVQLAVYRIVQELSLNIMKHADANLAHIDISVIDGQIHIMAKDNGKGFERQAVKNNGIGLKTIESKVKLLNGKIAIASKPTETIISIQLPL